MNLQEAYRKLGLNNQASDKEVTFAFKKLAAKYHPDVSKENNAEEKFKEINEAYQQIKNKDQSSSKFVGTDYTFFEEIFKKGFGRGFSGPFGSPFNIHFSGGYTRPFQQRHKVDITFTESITGCLKDISYDHVGECLTCYGATHVKTPTDKKCEKCDGKGFREYGNSKELPCTSCKSTGKSFELKQCENCFGTGKKEEKITTKVSIPPGVQTGNALSVDNIIININVKPEPNMQRQNNDVVSSLKISLLEALKGTTKDVKTVFGEKKLKIKGGRKHGDIIRAGRLGVPPYGSHLFVLDVEYPEDLTSIIEVLEKNQQQKEG